VMRRAEKKGGEVKRVQGTREQRERGVYVARTSFLTLNPKPPCAGLEQYSG